MASLQADAPPAEEAIIEPAKEPQPQPQPPQTAEPVWTLDVEEDEDTEDLIAAAPDVEDDDDGDVIEKDLEFPSAAFVDATAPFQWGSPDVGEDDGLGLEDD